MQLIGHSANSDRSTYSLFYASNTILTIEFYGYHKHCEFQHGGHQLNSCKRKKLLSIGWSRFVWGSRQGEREREEGGCSLLQREPQPLRERRGGESYMKGNASRIIARTMAD